MSVQHTPGPWFVYEETDPRDAGTRIHVASKANGWSATVCRVTPIIEGSRSRWAQEDMAEPGRHAADARLIAAAPELLDALISLCDVQNGPPLERYRAEWEAVMQQARAAIAKAEGGQG